MAAIDQPNDNFQPSGGDGPAELIRTYIAESFVLDEDELGPDTSLIDSGILDSTGVVEVVSYLEDTFGIELDDDDLVAENLDSVSRMARFVEAKRAGSAGS
jgi:acyl carrier protein